MTQQTFEVGDRVIYNGLSKPELGTITRVHVARSDDSPDALEVRTYDIQLDAGGNLLQVREHIARAPAW